jgi:hypothetical protein
MHGATYGILLLKLGTHLPPDPTNMREAITPIMPFVSSQSLSLVLSIRRIHGKTTPGGDVAQS